LSLPPTLDQVGWVIAVPSHAALIDFSRNTFEFDWVFLRISKILRLRLHLKGVFQETMRKELTFMEQ
jgi:hypothetical protein